MQHQGLPSNDGRQSIRKEKKMSTKMIQQKQTEENE